MYCAIKPLLTLTTAVLIEANELSWNDRIRDLTPCEPWVGDVTISDLLRHRSGLHRPNALEVYALGPEARRRVACTAPLQVPSLGSRESLYSEAAAWLVLGEALGALVDRPLVDLVRESVLEPLGIDDEFDLGDREDDGRLRVNVSVRLRGRVVPLARRRQRV